MAVYLDHNATTPLSPQLVESSSLWLRVWGNPSSIHWAGREAKNVLRETRQQLAQALSCHPLEIIFNSGGSEGNNTVIKSVWNQWPERKHFLVSQVEHPSVRRTYEFLEKLGAQVDYIPVSRQGYLDLNFVKSHLSEKTAMISVMLANNETGHIFPLQQISTWAHEKGALVHTDAVQALGKIPVNLSALGVDYATFSGHKFYSVKGAGFTYVKKGSPYESLILGGGQERHRRGGTENVVGIASLGQMVPYLSEVEVQSQRLGELRDHLEKRILSEISESYVTGPEALRLSNTSSLVLAGVDGETLLMSLDIKGYAVSTGAACSSGNPEPSPVLLAMGLRREEAQNSLRISLGWQNTPEEVDQFVDTLKNVVQRLRDLRYQRQGVSHV